MLEPGLYEQTVSKGLRKQLESASDVLKSETLSIEAEEAPKILAEYVASVAKDALERQGERSNDSLQSQVSLVNKMIGALDSSEDDLVDDPTDDLVDESHSQLLSLVPKVGTLRGVAKAGLPRPETPMAQSSLFTGERREPSMASELKKEIASADRIDMLVSFIKWSGLRIILPELEDFANRGGVLRVITTSYIGATDVKAIDALSKLPNTQVRVSYDTKGTRLHAKAYVFHRKTGFTTAYVGSSNLSNPAMTSGLEWNVKVAQRELPDTMDKIHATFDTYWESNDFEQYDESQHDRFVEAVKRERGEKNSSDLVYFFDLRPYPFQREILDKLRAEREVGQHWCNLVVAATGTGKTVISAFDYKDFCTRYRDGRRARMLFVAHREEILKQALATYRSVLRDANFGDLLVGTYAPESLDHLFASIQSVNSHGLTDTLPPDYYDYIVVDEFHHAPAPSYQRLLTHFSPKVLLGLTGTPERMDGKSVLPWFDNRVAAEIRLPEAIDRKLLCPFQYFGVTDEVDLSRLRWSRGGYETSQLEDVYVFQEHQARQRAEAIIRAVDRYVTDIADVKGIGFCVSVRHAEFMAQQFNIHGIKSVSVTGQTPEAQRDAAKRQLATGEVKFVFTVDVYNEGVDIPEVNTVLFLRPTDSLTIFLQQLGRGLRLSEGKDCLTVLDFIGQQNKRYDFESKLSALLSNTHRATAREVKAGFPSVPKGCYIHLEKVAASYVLENIRQSYGAKSGLLMRIGTFTEDTGLELTLTNFLTATGLDPKVIFARYSFSRLCVDAGEKDDFHDPDEELLTKALARICSIDSRRWIRFLLDALPHIVAGSTDFDANQLRWLRMLQVTLQPKATETELRDNTIAALRKLMGSNPTMFAEIRELLQYNLDHIDFVDDTVDPGFDCPLDLHCQYTRDQIFVGLDYLNPGVVRQGVRWLPDKKCDVLINTLNKSEKDYSPSTMYEDYSISESLFHWQSQSTTSDASQTGQRYIHHREKGTKVLLFVREFKTDMAGTAPFTFLGLVDYVSHEGSRPMNIIWHLERPMPAKFLRKSNRLAS
ncbi:MAG: DUF3427 domain-containing protein [Parafannyhessea sp.]|uniref:DUF3427 domain-containing protein n=1 Tax=Parafannyhessea sp. TaxID=2847324 RepID=UPI003F09EEDB